MTELETLQRAKMYMDKLANGINPLDGTVIPDTDIVNSVRLSRCFFYVADVLRQVIENGGVNVQKKAKKAPFFLTAEQRETFAFSNAPISISEISRRLNALIDGEKMSSITYNAIRDWLISLDLLAKVQDGSGKLAIRPTKHGENLGISLENRMGLEGPYFVVVYNVAAQHFILDNLDAILDFRNSKTENQGKPWTKEDEEVLCSMFDAGSASQDICNQLKRTKSSIATRLVYLQKIKERSEWK